MSANSFPSHKCFQKNKKLVDISFAVSEVKHYCKGKMEVIEKSI